MPRRHRRRQEQPDTPSRPTTTTPMAAPDGWEALRHRGGDPGPDYVCPRCARGVRRTGEHAVAWPSGEEDRRRHWHTECWRAAGREGIDRYRWS